MAGPGSVWAAGGRTFFYRARVQLSRFTPPSAAPLTKIQATVWTRLYHQSATCSPRIQVIEVRLSIWAILTARWRSAWSSTPPRRSRLRRPLRPCDSRKTCFVASTHTVTSLLRRFNREPSSRSAKDATLLHRRSLELAKRLPSQSVSFRSSIQPYERHRVSPLETPYSISSALSPY